MAIIWVIENDSRNRAHITDALMGNFAVRAFGSMKSAGHIAQLSKDMKPDCIVVTESCLKASSWGILVDLDITKVVLGTAKDRSSEKNIRYVEAWEDGFLLVTALKTLLSTNIGRSKYDSSLKYRDLQLDVENFELTFPLSGETEHLSKKEAMILKLLLQRPGECLARQEIKTRVWSNLMVTERTIDSHISRLRKRLRDSEARIECVYGGGYVLY